MKNRYSFKTKLKIRYPKWYFNMVIFTANVFLVFHAVSTNGSSYIDRYICLDLPVNLTNITDFIYPHAQK